MTRSLTAARITPSNPLPWWLTLQKISALNSKVSCKVRFVTRRTLKRIREKDLALWPTLLSSRESRRHRIKLVTLNIMRDLRRAGWGTHHLKEESWIVEDLRMVPITADPLQRASHSISPPPAAQDISCSSSNSSKPSLTVTRNLQPQCPPSEAPQLEGSVSALYMTTTPLMKMRFLSRTVIPSSMCSRLTMAGCMEPWSVQETQACFQQTMWKPSDRGDTSHHHLSQNHEAFQCSLAPPSLWEWWATYPLLCQHFFFNLSAAL